MARRRRGGHELLRGRCPALRNRVVHGALRWQPRLVLAEPWQANGNSRGDGDRLSDQAVQAKESLAISPQEAGRYVGTQLRLDRASLRAANFAGRPAVARGADHWRAVDLQKPLFAGPKSSVLRHYGPASPTAARAIRVATRFRQPNQELRPSRADRRREPPRGCHDVRSLSSVS